MPEAFFLPVEPGERFCVLHQPPPSIAPRRGVVYVHPFAEEMNKARRMAAMQARRLAAQGFSVLQIDLYGSGDSSGDFSEARWEIWLRDVMSAVRWLAQRVPPPVTLWGLRLGATLAAEVAQDAAAGIDHLLLWQPVANGAQFLSQFLRLRLAGEMLAGGVATSATQELNSELSKGRSLEIAGYELHPQLAAALGCLDLGALQPAIRRADWIEIGADHTLPLRRASVRVLEAWRARGIAIKATTVLGEPFWSTLEIAECHDLLGASLAAMSSPA